MKKKILFISYYFDDKLVTATRNYHLAKLLVEQGHEVHVLTKKNEKAKLLCLQEKITYHEVAGFDYRKILNWLGSKQGVTSELIRDKKIIDWGSHLLMKYPYNKYVGEGGGTYYVHAKSKAQNLIQLFSFTHMYSSYRPMTDHLIALEIKKKFKHIHWIGDFRDILWWKRDDKNYQSAWIQELLKSMDSITAVTKGIAAFWSQVSGKKVLDVYNGLPTIMTAEYEVSKKFILNYAGRIFTEFQRIDLLFSVLRELINENIDFKHDVRIQYAGLSRDQWNEWVTSYNLTDFNTSTNQISVEKAWQNIVDAQINILLTWTTKDVTGFIHGKFNEYVAARNPILCLIEGEIDKELESIYQPLYHSLVITNENLNRQLLKEFILNHYAQWKKSGSVLKLDDTTLFKFSWESKAKNLIDLISN